MQAGFSRKRYHVFQVYTVEGTSATAVGREPIVRVELVDTVNNALVAMRYLKVKWVKRSWRERVVSCFADSIYYCSNFTGRIGTQEMNEDIYDKAKRRWYDQAGIPRRFILNLMVQRVPAKVRLLGLPTLKLV